MLVNLHRGYLAYDKERCLCHFTYSQAAECEKSKNERLMGILEADPRQLLVEKLEARESST